MKSATSVVGGTGRWPCFTAGNCGSHNESNSRCEEHVEDVVAVDVNAKFGPLGGLLDGLLQGLF